MGCGNCGTGGAPSGCGSNGSCGTNSCNRMNAYDWLHNLPLPDHDDACRIVEISFNNGSRKEYYRNATLQLLEKGDWVALEGVSGFDVGQVQLTGELVRLQLKKRGIREGSEMKKILRPATERDLELYRTQKSREKEAIIRSRAIARQLKLNMKVSEVEFQADGKKATFYYIADDRVDFRELIKIYASEFRVKVEMRQIGARQESAKVGGIGSCGRELCCATWLTEFRSVNTAAARYQNLSINQTKLSGQCGRLKCCLNYELDTYLDALQNFPENADQLRVARGTATLIKKDIFKNLMWYVLPESSKQYPLTIERVQKIRSLNMQNVFPEDLEAVEVVSSRPKEVEPEFVDVVGQISLRSLEKADRKRREGARRKGEVGNREGGGRNQQPQQQQQQQRPARPPKGKGEGGGRPKPSAEGGQGQNGGQRPQRTRPQSEGGQKSGGEGGNKPKMRGRGGQRRPGSEGHPQPPTGGTI